MDVAVAGPAGGVQDEAEEDGVACADEFGVQVGCLRGAQAWDVRIESTSAPRLGHGWSGDGDDLVAERHPGDSAGSDLAAGDSPGRLTGGPHRLLIEDRAEGDARPMRGSCECASHGVVAGDVIGMAGQSIGADGEKDIGSQGVDRIDDGRGKRAGVGTGDRPFGGVRCIRPVPGFRQVVPGVEAEESRRCREPSFLAPAGGCQTCRGEVAVSALAAGEDA
nr:hypothetical protein [Nocardioides sp.]